MRTLGLSLLCALAVFALATSAASAVTSPAATGWGQNAAGQLGDATTEGSPVPVPVSGLGEVVSVAAGSEHTLALLPNGTVMAWGANTVGQLGDGNNTSSTMPAAVSGLSNVTAIAAGGEFSLALLSNGHVMAWGQNLEGELGNGLNNNSNVPVEVSGLSEVTAISAGGKHALALQSNGRVKAWGSDKKGQLGNGCSFETMPSCTDELTPVEVKELGGVTAISAGGQFSVALLNNGTVEAWGLNSSGQLGNATEVNTDEPVAVQGLIGVSAIAAGETHALAALTGGEVYAWGSDGAGELGNNTNATSSFDVPVQAMGLTEVTSVEAGNKFSLALQANGNVWTWGVNGQGQLGTGSEAPRSLVPVEVTDIHHVNQASAGGNHTAVAGPVLPTVTAVNPVEGPPTGGTHVTITGTGFSEVSAVHFGANAAVEYTVESTTTIQAVAPAGAGRVPVTVTIPGGTSATIPASDFSYVPIVTSVSPPGGSQEGGTAVVIHGTNFEGVETVDFAANAATNVKVVSGTEVTAVSPPGVGTVDVTLVGPGGRSIANPADQFSYAASPPEVGRCAKATGKGAAANGKYSDPGCITLNAQEKGSYEWLAGTGKKSEVIAKAVKGETIRFETVGGRFWECKSSTKLKGTYASAKLLTNVTISFTGCSNGIKGEGGARCTTAGAREGQIVTKVLTAQLGIIKTEPEPAKDQVGFAIGAQGNGTFMEFECSTFKYVVSGGAILPYKTTDRMVRKANVKYLQDKGHQNVESFENEPRFVLSAKIGAGPVEQLGMILTLEWANKEKLEVNLLH
ncbi:MAG TPA: IPT/TIG domain-containing protein [Solirubrobacteraceae bacterium]|nr:IPT/TIG domain-containing protein [Solirubrobacteraceae bacterium]